MPNANVEGGLTWKQHDGAIFDNNYFQGGEKPSNVIVLPSQNDSAPNVGSLHEGV